MASFFKFSNDKTPSDVEAGKASTTKSSSSSENESCFPTLSYKERLLGFGMCYVLGLLVQVMSMFSMGRSLTKTAVLVSVGNIISLMSTSFLVGFQRQFKNMRDKTRLTTTVVFLFSLIMTFVAALILKVKILVLLFLLIQFLSFFWYSLSYIPYGRTIFTKCVSSCLKK